MKSIFLATVLSLTLAAQTPQSFEAASVRENPGPTWRVRVGYTTSGSRLTLQVWSIPELIQEAFNLKRYAVIMAPMSGGAFYDITAKVEGDNTLTKAEFRPYLQTLLADRFKLKFHRETREMPVYAMVVGKTGIKFKESDPEESAPKRFFGVNGRNQYMDFTQATMEMVADGIGVDKPVIDKTGLTGKYNIRLETTPEFRIGNNPQPEDIRVFEAIQQQLGLRLDAQKAGIEVLVVDHVEKPSEN